MRVVDEVDRVVVVPVVPVLPVPLVPVMPPVPVVSVALVEPVPVTAPLVALVVVLLVLEYDVLDESVDDEPAAVSVPTVAFVFDSCLQLNAKSVNAAIARTAKDFFIRSSPLQYEKTPCAWAGRFHEPIPRDQCFLVVVFFVWVIEPPIVVVPVVPDVVVAVVPVVLVALVSVSIVPDVSVDEPAGIADVAVEPLVPVVLLIAVPDESVVDIVDDVSLDAAAVSVTLVFSSFLQAKANSASARTIRIASDLFIQTLL